MNDPTDMCEDFVSTLTGVVRTCEDSRNIYYTTTTFFFLQLTLNNIQGPHSPHHYEKSPHKVLTKSSQVLTHPQKCTQKCTKLWTAVGNETIQQNATTEQNKTMKKISEEFLKINDNFSFIASLFPIIIAVIAIGAVVVVLPRFIHNDYDYEPPIYSFSSSTSIDDDASIGDGTQPIKVEVSKPIVQQEPVKKKDKHELHIDEQMEAWTASHSDMSPKMLRGQRMLFKNEEYKTRKRRKPRKPAETKISPVESNTPYGK